MRFLWVLVLLSTAVPAAERPADQARLAVLESKMADFSKNLDSISIKLDKVSIDLTAVNTSIQALNLKLSVLETKMSVVEWVGSAIGLLLLGTLWKLMTERGQIAAAIATSTPTPAPLAPQVVQMGNEELIKILTTAVQAAGKESVSGERGSSVKTTGAG